ncbi:hypothetical protein BABINDRAFT_8451 [Babjeviella inositovora NRRL Y-12698]|uniref:TLC domain-containing protein n=1 Tax=Babjeviella inositovora NRRL Y-12698 TaxID=984486 RepID=A0A1E3QPC3_9ASCO|nr:uncharacterized protein BABINDRAFT_8451 [Babjeviella inositovora NRRL Y-12698]ODQ79535.1 hypothetical protein BABINDRAFT_8451 [Babjeviella inositovora NRRL Y-12698]
MVSLFGLFPYIHEDIFLQYRPFPETTTNVAVAHWHEVAGSFVFYLAVHFLAPHFSRTFCPKAYASLSPKNRANFDIHHVAMVQALISIVVTAFFWNNPDWTSNDIHGYRPFGGFISAITVGYFIWDLAVCARYFHLFGVGFLAHAVAALAVFAATLIPFCQPWVPCFLLFELSSPFVNMNWYASRLPEGTFSNTFVLVNGLCLMVTFFSVRIVWGFYAIYTCLWSYYTQWATIDHKWVPIMIVSLNTMLNVLNVFWFTKMVQIAIKKVLGKSRSKKLE